MPEDDVFFQWRYSSGGTSAWENLERGDVPLQDLRFGDFDGDGKTDVFTIKELDALPPSVRFTNWIHPLDNSTYVRIPAGEIQLGSETVSNSVYFWLMTTEVTNGQYRKCFEANPDICTEPIPEKGEHKVNCREQWENLANNKHPVICVNLEQAINYARYVSGHIPSEEEWEKACRGINGYDYPWGDNVPNPNLLNFREAYRDVESAKPVAVGSYPAGEYGLFDMAGNAWEWTTGRENPDSSGRSILRGGAFGSEAEQVRCDFRAPGIPDLGGHDRGFRVVYDDTNKISSRDTDGMEMIYVPGGTFMMGSDDSDLDPQDKYPHPVDVSSFWIDRTEVSNAQYRLCVEAEVCKETAFITDQHFDKPNYPIVGVDWQGATDYCQWAGGRLPKEDEWEYAARGPEGNRYPWGNSLDSKDRSLLVNSGIDDKYEFTAPVYSFFDGASWIGALNMAGNVWEWTNDTPNPYPDSPDKDGNAYDPTRKVMRGGSWDPRYPDINLHAAHRGTPLAILSDSSTGIRCVMDLDN